MNKAVVVSKLKRQFGKTFAINDISFTLPETGIYGIVGASGSGKSTLLNILSGLDDGYEGKVRVLGKNIGKMNVASRREFRLKNVGYVFQNFNLLELENAENNVMLTMDALFACPKEEKRKKALDLLTFLGVEKKAKQKVNTLSGGEKQRIAIARALANDPKILLCDEPTGALDQRRAKETFALLRRCGKDRLVIVVSHDLELSEQYCDCLIRMRDGKIEEITQANEREKDFAPKSFILGKRRKSSRISASFLFSHAFHLLRAKKIRSFIAEGAIAMGLSGLGLSVYVSSSISDELNGAFQTLVPPSAVVMTPRSGGENPIGAIYGAGEEECLYAIEEYGDMVNDYGTDFHLDYENWFVDRNDFTYSRGASMFRLPDFSVRHINDFLWFNPAKAPMCYPRTPATLRIDQVVLGLPYATMFQTCLNLQIIRDYQSLGDYIDIHGFELVLHIANYEYQFDDEELFDVVAVVESPFPCIYHVDHHWNHKIFVDTLRFRSSLTEETPNPQYVFEIPYLDLNCPASEFLSLARRDPALSHLVYEMANASYVPSLCQVGAPCKLNRLYLYGADKSGASFATLDECMKLCPEIAGRQPVTVGSYYASSGSLAMGFVGKFFVCNSEESAERIIDFYSDLPLEAANLPGENIEGTKDGSYFSSASQGTRFSSDIENISEGVAPQGVEECLISTSLAKKWGSPNEIYIAAEVGGEERGSRYVRQFGSSKLKVTGIKEESHDTVYVCSDWSVDFYLQELGMSSFLLEPYGAVFSLKQESDAKAVVERLAKAFGDYSFSNPAEEISSSISSTLGYIGVILGAFSVISLFMSALLFLIVMTITVSENYREADMMSVLGVCEKDIHRSFLAQAILYAGGATGSSLLMLLFAEIFTKFYIAQSFQAEVTLSLPFFPFLSVLIAGLTFTIFVMLGISLNLHRKLSKK